jgi:hypothetical protein
MSTPQNIGQRRLEEKALRHGGPEIERRSCRGH